MTSNRLDLEIAEARRKIATDGYPMSIGEITNLYRDGELIIRPQFQRFFRWSELQKSRLVESLLLGIPLPSIFVAQEQSGAWELVDGLQRISTVLQLQGELKGEAGVRLPPLVLRGTKYLPSLEGRQWENDDAEKSLSAAQRIDIKRAKIDVSILKRESSAETKYDLFERLNSYGSALSPQEGRSAVLVAISPEFFSWIEELSYFQPFVDSVSLGERLIAERYDVELVLRFIVLHNRGEGEITERALRDFSQTLTDDSVNLAKRFPADKVRLEDIFRRTFVYISENGGESVFRRWDQARGKFRGAFLNTSFEVFALGVGYHMANGKAPRKDLEQAAKDFWTRSEMAAGFATGRSTENRLAQVIPLGRQIVSRKRKGRATK